MKYRLPQTDVTKSVTITEAIFEYLKAMAFRWKKLTLSQAKRILDRFADALAAEGITQTGQLTARKAQGAIAAMTVIVNQQPTFCAYAIRLITFCYWLRAEGFIDAKQFDLIARSLCVPPNAAQAQTYRPHDFFGAESRHSPSSP